MKDSASETQISDENIDLKRLASRLKFLRKKAGYTNADAFAFAAQVHRAQYARYEAAASDVRYTSLMKVIRALGMTPQEFFAEGFGD